MSRILVLSLGKGNKTSNEEGYPYITANYRMDGSDKIVNSPFVAEALIHEVNPDVIVIIGTVTSAWGAFYHRYHREQIEDFESRWNGIEERISNMGRSASDDEISSFQEYINDLFNKDLNINNCPKIDVCMIKYGLNESELIYTYDKIKNHLKSVISDYTADRDDINISFDITHSFRSIPIYNLVVINYCRLLISNKIRISHVYYGNLDVARENNGIAEIVDLKEIVNVLETTRGISEFINTGNAATLLGWLNDDDRTDDQFINALKGFNEALYLNKRNDIQLYIESLIKIPLNDEKDAVSDAKRIIQDILRREITLPDKESGDDKQKQLSEAAFQLSMAKWCLGLGQVGLAASFAIEAFKSFLVVVYEEDPSKYGDDNRRKRAEQLFGVKVENTKEKELFARYKESAPLARLTRNTYAHNLEMSETECIKYDEACVAIKEYIEDIEKIMQSDIEDLKDGELEKIAILITNANDQKTLDEYAKCIYRPNTRIYCLRGMDFVLPTTEVNTTIKRFCRIISKKVEELYDGTKDCTITKMVFGDDIDERISRNCALMISSYIKGLHLNYYTCPRNSGKKRTHKNLEFDYIWEIDLSNEFNNDKLSEIRLDLSHLRFEEIIKTAQVAEKSNEKKEKRKNPYRRKKTKA